MTRLFPFALLWLLGPQYQGLDLEVLIAVVSGAVTFLSNVLWTIHSARRFVYWWNVGLSIVLTLMVQVLFIMKADVSTVRGVLYLSLGMNFVSLLVNVLSGAYGFVNGPRDTEKKAIAREVAAEEESHSEDYPLADGSAPDFTVTNADKRIPQSNDIK